MQDNLARIRLHRKAEVRKISPIDVERLVGALTAPTA